jgi:hypothetical protein
MTRTAAILARTMTRIRNQEAARKCGICRIPCRSNTIDKQSFFAKVLLARGNRRDTGEQVLSGRSGPIGPDHAGSTRFSGKCGPGPTQCRSRRRWSKSPAPDSRSRSSWLPRLGGYSQPRSGPQHHVVVSITETVKGFSRSPLPVPRGGPVQAPAGRRSGAASASRVK